MATATGNAGNPEGPAVNPYHPEEVGLLANATGPEDIVPDLNSLSTYVSTVYAGDAGLRQAGPPGSADSTCDFTFEKKSFEFMLTDTPDIVEGATKDHLELAATAIRNFTDEAKLADNTHLTSAASSLKDAVDNLSKYFEKRLSKLQRRLDREDVRVEQATNDIRLVMRSETGVSNATNKIQLRLLLDDARVAFRFAVVTYDSNTYDFGMELKRNNTGHWWDVFEQHMQKTYGASRSHSMWFECQAIFAAPFEILSEKLHKVCNEKVLEIGRCAMGLETAKDELAKAKRLFITQQQKILLAKKGREKRTILRPQITKAEIAKKIATVKSFEVSSNCIQVDLANAKAAWQCFHTALSILRDEKLFAYLENKYDTAAYLIRDRGNDTAHPRDRRDLVVSAVQQGRMFLDPTAKEELIMLHEAVYPIFKPDGEIPRKIPALDTSFAAAVDAEVVPDFDIDIEFYENMLLED